MLLGITGGVFALLAEYLVAPLKGKAVGEILSGDRAWPTAILMTLVVPPVIPVLHWLAIRFKPAWKGWLQALAIAGGTYLWSVITLFVMAG
jgi:hypothetical protein